MVITQPFECGGQFAGFVFVSVLHERLELQDGELKDENLTVITFTASSKFLTATGRDAEDPQAVLPQTRLLETLVGVGSWAFSDRTASGKVRNFAVSPIFADTVYALGTWQPMSVAANAPFAIPPQFFPVIMSLTSPGIAIAAIHRLVICHIRRLRRQMLESAARRTLPTADHTSEVSAEIADIQMSFVEMAETVIRDEAELEQLVHNKNVLLKEVHHRVKNNLQLTSSIMNMQVRQVKSPEAKAAVQRLQDRGLGLVSIHRSLYRTENLDRVQTAQILAELTDQILTVGQGSDGAIALERQFDEVDFYPDQAGSLSLLEVEATTNALKYMGDSTGKNRCS
ncbi:MAG: sensor histidine kinase [Rhodobacteraceae bacterium]|nr:sensor histidine kinase [Paracoccaceae bacterium]